MDFHSSVKTMTDLEEARKNMGLLGKALKKKTEAMAYGAPDLMAIDHDN